MRIATMLPITLTFLACQFVARCGADEPMKYSDHVKWLLRILPTETESLVVLKGGDCRVVRESDLDPVFPCGAQGALHVIRRGKFRERLDGKSVVLAAQASCRFTPPPRDRQPMQYAGAQLVLFEDDINVAVPELQNEFDKAADDLLGSHDRKVWRFNETWNRQEWAFFVAFPTSKLLVVATDEKFLETLIKRTSAAPDDSFLTDRQLQALIPFEDELWAVRQYQWDATTKPIAPPDSVGFVVCIFIEKKEAQISFIARRDTSAEVVAKYWTLLPPEGEAPSTVMSKDGRFKLQHSFDTNDQLGGFIILLRMRLGHY